MKTMINRCVMRMHSCTYVYACLCECYMILLFDLRTINVASGSACSLSERDESDGWSFRNRREIRIQLDWYLDSYLTYARMFLANDSIKPVHRFSPGLYVDQFQILENLGYTGGYTHGYILGIIYDIPLCIQGEASYFRISNQVSLSKYLVSWREESAVTQASGVSWWWSITAHGGCCWSRGSPLSSVIVAFITAMAVAASGLAAVIIPASVQPRSLHANT